MYEISNIGVLTIKYSREAIVTESFNETTLDIYVKPQDTEYVYTGPIDQIRRNLKPKGAGSRAGLSRLVGGESTANYNLTWEVIDESDDHVDIQLYFAEVFQISSKLE